MQKIVQVDMLPTDNLSNLCVIDYHNGKKDMLSAHNNDAFKKESSSDVSIFPQYLYFTSEEEIKEGEWFVVDCTGLTSHNTIGQFIDGNKKHHKGNIRKIVATTNPELWGNVYVQKAAKRVIGEPIQIGIPKIPLSFVKQYVEKQVKEAKLEYVEMNNPSFDRSKGVNINNPTYLLHLKLDSQGCVIISPIEEKIDWEQVFDDAQSMHLQEFINYYKDIKIN